MRPTMAVVSLLLLLVVIIANTVQGIRMEEESIAALHKITNKEGPTGGKEAIEVAVPCRKEDDLCTGRSRKLMAKAMATSKSHSMKEVTNKGREDFHKEPAETYPDILDIAGMDYSPAKRKPPIHN